MGTPSFEEVLRSAEPGPTSRAFSARHNNYIRAGVTGQGGVA